MDPNPGAENPNPAELEDGSHGRPVRPTRRRRRNRDTSHDELDYENDAYEVDIGEEPTGYAPPDGVRAPVGPDQGRNVDVEA